MIVVAGIDDRLVRQRKELLAYRIKELFRRAALEIRPAVAADEERVSGKDSAGEHIARTSFRMTGGGNCRQRRLAEPQRFAVGKEPIATGDHLFSPSTVKDL